VLLALGCCCPERTEIVSALPSPIVCSLGYPWFLGTQTFSKNLSCSKIESTFVMTPHGFKGLILQESEFWGNIRRILPTHVNIRKRWQVLDEVLWGWVDLLSLSFRVANTGKWSESTLTLSNHFAAGRKYVITLLPSVPIVGNPGEARDNIAKAM